MKKRLLTSSCNEEMDIINLKRNAFTLIELLAIIVILAIIAVITVPIILNIIENSRMGAATDSAYGYKDSINKWYVSKLSNDRLLQLEGKYTVENGVLKGDNIEDTNIPVSGTIPSSGTLTYSNNTLTEGCLVIGEYAVTFEDGTVSNTEKGECEPNISIIVKRNGATLTTEQTIAVGDTVTLYHGSYNDEFVVILIDSATNTATLLAENNLNVGSSKDSSLPEGFQGTNGSNYGVPFAGSQYWASNAADIYDSTKNDATGDYYSVAYYVNNYVTNLRNVGFTQVQTTGARILRKSEVESINIGKYKDSGEEYWLGSASFDDNLYYWSGYINSNNYPATYIGVRPIIVILTSDL